MRKVQRPIAPTKLIAYLNKKKVAVAAAALAGRLDIEKLWKYSRQTKTIGTIALQLLQGTMGRRERCMYCLDGHGTDIEHFWPKAPYPHYAFNWDNWLLCCTECGRIKGSKFPRSAAGAPLLVDPCADDPWQHLDFDADTGNLMARYDKNIGAPSPKGLETVKTLELNQRESLAEGYRLTHMRLTSIVEAALNAPQINGAALVGDLLQADDHGLLPWCFHWAGQKEAAFSSLKATRPNIWNMCAAAV